MRVGKPSNRVFRCEVQAVTTKKPATHDVDDDGSNEGAVLTVACDGGSRSTPPSGAKRRRMASARVRLDFSPCLLDQPVDIGIGKTAATTRTRDFRRASASPSAGSMTIDTGSSGPTPRRSNSPVTSATVVSMMSAGGIRLF